VFSFYTKLFSKFERSICFGMYLFRERLNRTRYLRYGSSLLIYFKYIDQAYFPLLNEFFWVTISFDDTLNKSCRTKFSLRYRHLFHFGFRTHGIYIKRACTSYTYCFVYLFRTIQISSHTIAKNLKTQTYKPPKIKYQTPNKQIHNLLLIHILLNVQTRKSSKEIIQQPTNQHGQKPSPVHPHGSLLLRSNHDDIPHTHSSTRGCGTRTDNEQQPYCFC